jgi:hypothetical protein
MISIAEKRIQKTKMNDGTKIERTVLDISFPDVDIKLCGCGGIPHLYQRPDGKPFYDYNGEFFYIGCPKCGIKTKEHHNGWYYDEVRYIHFTKEYVVDLVLFWNKAMINNKDTTVVLFAH